MAVCHVLGHGKVANLGKICRLHFILAIQRESKRQLHIRLAAAKPHIAHHHVLQLDRLAPRDLQCVRAACLGRIDLHLPASVAPRRASGRVAADLHTNRITGLRPAPDRVRFAALQDHVVAKDRAQKWQRLGHGLRRSGALGHRPTIRQNQESGSSNKKSQMTQFHRLAPQFFKVLFKPLDSLDLQNPLLLIPGPGPLGLTLAPH